MRITGDDLRKMRAKAAVPRSRIVDRSMVLFIPGTLENPMNWGSGWKWFKQARWTKKWHEATANQLFLAPWSRNVDLRGTAWAPTAPKRITLKGHVRRRFDTQDNLSACFKPIVDYLVEAGVIHGDGPDCGHEFVYDQVNNRSWRGAEVKVELR